MTLCSGPDLDRMVGTREAEKAIEGQSFLNKVLQTSRGLIIGGEGVAFNVLELISY